MTLDFCLIFCFLSEWNVITLQCTLKIWDFRQTQRPTHKVGGTEFEAGVTAISPHPTADYIFAAGSYDEYVRIYDHRKMGQPMAKINVGGGVWRIKWHPTCWEQNNETTTTTHGYGKMLVAAMHGGCRVVNTSAENVGSVEIVSKFTAHESMAYGADWVWSHNSSSGEVAASCSFYDRHAFLWDPYTKNEA